MPNRRQNNAATARRRRQPNSRRRLPGIPLRITGAGNTGLHRFTRIFDSIILAQTSDSGGAYDFKLNNVPGYTELTVLFDQYRIEAVEVTFTATQPATSNAMPRLFVCFDPDDADVPTSKVALLERGNLAQRTFTQTRRSFTFNVEPVAVISSDTEAPNKVALQAPRKTWVDCNQPSTYYYGLKYWLEDFNSGLGSPIMKVMFRYHLVFRSSR